MTRQASEGPASTDSLKQMGISQEPFSAPTSLGRQALEMSISPLPSPKTNLYLQGIPGTQRLSRLREEQPGQTEGWPEIRAIRMEERGQRTFPSLLCGKEEGSRKGYL